MAIDMELTDGSRVAVAGGGPAGAFASYFLLDIAERVGLNLAVDIYEPKDFTAQGPGGCNNCGGIISERLVQMLALEGINLSPTVVQRGIDSYVLHTDLGSVRIAGASNEKRIASVHRGAGPRGGEGGQWESFDGHLLGLARAKGANVVSARVEDITWESGKPRVQARGGSAQTYDLLVGALGVNSPALKVFQRLGFGYRLPGSFKTYVGEFRLGAAVVAQYLGSSMHVFLVDMPRLEFAAVIPKGDYATVCILGRDIDKDLVDHFLKLPALRACFPPGWIGNAPACHCSPRINVHHAIRPFGDRVVLVGDSAVTRLYKDGIGAAYRTAKASALTAVLHGVAAEDFRRHYWPICRRLATDNRFGEAVFASVGVIRRVASCRRAMLEIVRKEQLQGSARREMSGVLWDTFTGSDSYRSIFQRAMRPFFLLGLITASARALVPARTHAVVA